MTEIQFVTPYQRFLWLAQIEKILRYYCKKKPEYLGPTENTPIRPSDHITPNMLTQQTKPRSN